MRVDHDGRIRMDCSSPYAMAGLIDLKDRFDISFGNDSDFDRHGIVTPQRRLDEPESLPGGRDLVPVSAPLLERRCGGWEDAGEQQHD